MNWDPTKGPQPNLSRLPVLERERITTPLPLRVAETYGLVCIFQSQTYVHPNGRVNVAPYYVNSTNDPMIASDGVQIDLNDFSGRIPAASVVMTANHARTVIAGLIHAFVEVGGCLEDVLSDVINQKQPDTLHSYPDGITKK